MKIALLLAAFSLTVSCSLSANILAVLPLPFYSHFHGYQPIFKELARRGHNVTVVSPFPLKAPLPNYTDVVLHNKLEEGFTANFRDMVGLTYEVFGLYSMCPPFLDEVFKLPEMKRFINEDKSHFDLVMTETILCCQPFHALGHKYNAPVISFQPMWMNLVTAEYSKNPLPVTYTLYQSIPADRTGFLDKAKSTLYFVLEYLSWHLYFKGNMERYMRDNFRYPGSENVPPLDDLLYNTSLVLLDNHLALSTATPFLPNIAQIGGIALKEAAPLPQDLEKFMNESKDGVVFFSWGSLYKATNMNPEVLAKILSVFSKLKQRVLFKWENETLPGKPDNVRIGSWFPQASILAHPKLRVFISHCGIHGVSEAVYHGVPVLATPLFADQLDNAIYAEWNGFAIRIDVDSFSEQQLLDALNKLIYDPKYKSAAVRQSAVLREQPLGALGNAVYWIEYVIRHSGAHHLKPSRSTPAWTVLLFMALPYLALLLAALAVPLYCINILLNKLCQALKESKEKIQKKKD